MNSSNVWSTRILLEPIHATQSLAAITEMAWPVPDKGGRLNGPTRTYRKIPHIGMVCSRNSVTVYNTGQGGIPLCGGLISGNPCKTSLAVGYPIGQKVSAVARALWSCFCAGFRTTILVGST